jgi:hypothetical protein
MLANVGQTGSATNPLNTNIGTLAGSVSGPLYLDQAGALTLGALTTTNLLNITADSSITSSAPLVSSGALIMTANGAAGNISLTGQNSLSGAISLAGNGVSLTNDVATNLASVTATSLTVNSAGDITQTGAITVSGSTALSAPGSHITLNNAGNNFSSLNVGGALTVSVTDVDRIDSGIITADNVTLTTQNGLGALGAPLVTNTAKLAVNNTVDNGVYITNNGAATVGITNLGNIEFTNNGNLTIDRLYTNGGQYSTAGPYTGDIQLVVNGGGIGAYMGNPPYQGLTYHLPELAPDIVAQNLTVRVLDGGFGSTARPMSLSVFDTFTYLGGPGYVHYYLGRKPLVEVDVGNSLIRFSSLGGLTSQQLLEIESLGEFDPAIFTAIRNYYYEDVAILMPADQRLDGSDEDEDEKAKDEEKEEKQL